MLFRIRDHVTRVYVRTGRFALFAHLAAFVVQTSPRNACYFIDRAASPNVCTDAIL